jgi:hypothetical protein
MNGRELVDESPIKVEEYCAQENCPLSLSGL